MSEIIDLKTAKESTSSQIWESILEMFPDFRVAIDEIVNELGEVIFSVKVHAGSVISKKYRYQYLVKMGLNRAKKYRYKQWAK